MTKIYLIRHAESLANTRGIYQGQSYDTDLSPLGLLQIKALADRFVGEKFDTVFASPLKRTVQTAQVLGDIVLEPSLLETNHGAWEGLSKDVIRQTWPDLYQRWQTHPSDVQFPAGEHFQDTAKRSIAWLDSTLSKPGTIAAVTHGNIIQILLTYLFGRDLNAIYDFFPQSTAVTLINTASVPRVVYHNDISHLNKLQSDLSLHAI